MGHRRTLLERCGQYGTLFAVEKVAEMLRDAFLDQPGIVSLNVEDDDWAGFDDVVERRLTANGETETVGWQVKRSTEPLDRATMLQLLVDLSMAPGLSRGVLGVAQLVSVQGVGELKALRDLCRRAAQPGNDHDKLLRRPRKTDHAWLALSAAATRGSKRDGLKLLARFAVSAIEFEEQIAERTEQHLTAAFEEVPQGLRAELEHWLRPLEGTVAITERLVDQQVLFRFRDRQPALVTRAKRASARTDFLQAAVRLVSRTRPLDAIASRVLIPLGDLTLDRVHVEPTTSRSTKGDLLSAGVPLALAQASRARVALLGDLGAGKSVAMRSLLSQLATAALSDYSAPVPVLVHAREVVDGRWRVAAAARAGMPEDRLNVALGRPWVLLVDGVDEVGSAAWDSIEQVAAASPQCTGLIAAARPLIPPPERPAYVIVQLQPWTETQSDAFLAKWEQVAPEAVRVVRRHLTTRALSPALLSNPLTATLCLTIAGTSDDLPDSRAALLAQLARLLFDSWRRTRPASNPSLSWGTLVAGLGVVAVGYLKSGGRPMSGTGVWRTLRSAVQLEGEAVAEEAVLQMGLLVPGPNATYDFAVRPLAEYFAAEQFIRLGEEDLLARAHAPWALESSRLAISLLAEPHRIQQGARCIEYAAALTLRSSPTFEADFLRPLVLAIRVACDLPDATTGAVGRRLAAAVVRVVVDESSTWMGDVVADEARHLARTPGACWDAIVHHLRPRAARFGEEPPGWYAARSERTSAVWLGVLFHRDPWVRALALARLAPHRNDEAVRKTLVGAVRDEGIVLGAMPPAIGAAEILRAMPRGPWFEPVQARLRELLKCGCQVTATAASVALRPAEAELTELVRALRVGTSAFVVPPRTIAELARAPGGERALDDGWPDWRSKQSSLVDRPPWRPTPTVTDGPPAPSHWVRLRIMNLCTFAFQGMSDADLALFGSRSQYSGDRSLADALVADPLLADRLDLRHLPTDAHLHVGEAALRSARLRDRLIAAWDDATFHVPSSYPGVCLEPLVERGDPDAARIYAAWLPNSIYTLIAPSSGRRPRPAALRNDEVLGPARDLALQLITNATPGRPEGKLVAHGPTGDMLNHLAEAWRDHPPVFARLTEWVRSGQDRAFSGALWALWSVPLPDELRSTIERELRRRLHAVREKEADADQLDDSPSWLGWIDDMQMATCLHDEIEALVTPSTRLGWIAGAVVLPSMNAERARALSSAVAPVAVKADEYMLRSRFLRRYVHAAERAWTTAAITAIERGELLDEVSGLRLMKFLGAENRAAVGAALLRSPAADSELPWMAQGGDGFACARPADLVRKIVFDLGI